MTKTGLVLGALLASIPFARADDPGERVAGTETEATDAAPFGTVVARNWAAWAAGRDAVTREELTAAMARPEFRAEDAAALAALDRWAAQNDPVDRASAVGLDDAAALKRYRANVAKLRSAKRTLYASGTPDFSLLEQGPAGDCYFFSGAGWIARYRPQVIVQAIVALADGSFQVTFPNGDSAVVTAPTDSEMAFNDSASTLTDGFWMPILEKATGVVMARRNARSAQVEDPTLAIDVPSGPMPVVERFTGKGATGHELGARANRAKVRKALVRMHERRLMAEVLLLHRPAAKLAWDHVYAVLGYDARSQVVVLWNPWGTDFQPSGPSGPANGYARVRGVFQIPFDEFVEFFTFLAIEKA